MSIQDIQQNPQDTSNFYLSNIYQTLANPNQSNVSTSLHPSPPPFSPPNHAVWVNALWFLSLVISLTCALLATLLQQWARRYLKITQSRYSPHKRARIRAFFAEGVEKCLLPWTVGALPTLLHISLFLFFAGLVVFLCNVNLTIFKLVFSWVGLCTALYGCITCMPIIRHDSPYYTPLSLPAWHIVTGILFFIYRFLRWFNWSVRSRYDASRRLKGLHESCRRSLAWGMQKSAEETALTSPSEIDTRAFMWTFDCLDEDHELERFFSGLPGFRCSNVVDDPLISLTEEEKSRLYKGLRGVLDRTFSSDLLPVPVKNRRAIICAKAVDPGHTRDAFNTLDSILTRYQYSGPLATGIATILRGWGRNVDQDNILYAQLAISKTIAARQRFDDSWYILASNELAIAEVVLREYAAHGDNLSLVILIHLVRQQFIHFRKSSRLRHAFSSVLAAASNFNVKVTSPKLQHEFCALWNQILNEAEAGNIWDMAFLILAGIRNVYLALHQDTDSAPIHFSASTSDHSDILRQPSSYPLCKVPSHHSNSKAHIHADDASTTIVRAIPHDQNIPASPSISSPDSDSISASGCVPLRVHESLTNVSLLDDDASMSVQTHTTTELRSNSPYPVTSGATHGCLDTSQTSPRITHLSTLQPAVSRVPPKSNASTSPTDAATVEPTAVSYTPSRDVKVLSSSSTLVLDNLPPIGMLFTFRAYLNRSDCIYFSLESHSPILPPAATDPSILWDPVAARAEEDAKATSSQEMGKGERDDDTMVTSDDL